MTLATPWYVDICNYLVASTYPRGASQAAKHKLATNAKYYVWDDPFGMPKALINDQGSHFCNCAMVMLLEKYGVVQ
ncbi:hypothetical protein CR513_05561, partial [Mucuna pruriens]